MTMGKAKLAASATVTISCPDHHQVLVNRLWKFFSRQHKADWEFKIGGRSIFAHGLIAEVFLNASDDESGVCVADESVTTDHSYHQPGKTSLDRLLEFMYNGRVTVPRDRLDHLLSLAQELKFKLLVEAIARSKQDDSTDNLLGTDIGGLPHSVPAVKRSGLSPRPAKTTAPKKRNAVVTRSSRQRVLRSIKKAKVKDDRSQRDSGSSELPDEEAGKVVDDRSSASSDEESVSSGVRATHSDPDYVAPSLETAENFLKRRSRKSGAPERKCKIPVSDCNCPKCNEQRPFSCEHCPLTFASIRQRNVHVTKSHLADGLHHCPDCDYSSARRHLLEAHRRRHTGDKPYTCEICGKQFSRVSNFGRHKMIHSDARNYMCHECGDSFKSYDAMTQHLLRHRGIVRPYVPSSKRSACKPGSKPRSLSCVMCAFVASRGADMTRHCRTVHTVATADSQRPFGCPTCGASFRSFQQFVNHWRVHTGERPFECHVCQKKFSQEIHMKVHSLIHTGQKPHKCDVCGRDFAQLQNMKAHRRTHFGEQVRRVRKRKLIVP